MDNDNLLINFVYNPENYNIDDILKFEFSKECKIKTLKYIFANNCYLDFDGKFFKYLFKDFSSSEILEFCLYIKKDLTLHYCVDLSKMLYDNNLLSQDDFDKWIVSYLRRANNLGISDIEFLNKHKKIGIENSNLENLIAIRSI